MRILVIADEESKWLWDYFEKEKLEGIDLILSAGDLNPRYLSFLATFTTAPVLYVHGNHDDKYEKICIFKPFFCVLYTKCEKRIKSDRRIIPKIIK